MGWLIDDWFRIGHRIMDTGPEGTGKTILRCWIAVNIAAGHDILGHKVQQGPVLLVDEETPQESLDNLLQRFALGLGYKDWRELPITRLSGEGFRFGRRTEMAKLLHKVEANVPVFISMDSLIAMLPSGRQGLVETDSTLGEAIRDDLNTILQVVPQSCIMQAAHSKKYVAEDNLAVDQLNQKGMTIVRGHGSIVGQGCDTGLILKKFNENPLQIAIITKARRSPVKMSLKPVYIELCEKEYGKGPARLVEIPPTKIPPSKLVKSLYKFFSEDRIAHSAASVAKTFALHSRAEVLHGIEELERYKVIMNGRKPQSWQVNLDITQYDKDYLKGLRQ